MERVKDIEKNLVKDMKLCSNVMNIFKLKKNCLK